jgi:hypothetical protein
MIDFGQVSGDDLGVFDAGSVVTNVGLGAGIHYFTVFSGQTFGAKTRVFGIGLIVVDA